MGGKNKSNRTKNNARPSSSARSAELLGNQAPVFFGFSSGKSSSVTVLPGIVATPGEIDSSVDTNFQLALKRMVKKDATTKLKALQEFSDLCNKADVDEVKAILPFWPRLYSQLCADPGHRVREAAHLSHKAVIAKVKKHLAPFLKDIIGPWYSAQYDTYPPAASAAVASFQEAFSSTKMVEVLAFCQNEILDYFYQNIVVHTPQTLSNPKSNSPEELEDKYRRVVSSSLLAYSSYLQRVSADNLERSLEGNKKIIASAKFWKFSGHKDPIIRHAFFSVLIALCQCAQILIQTETSRVAGAVFHHLAEEDSLVLPLVWEAVLHCVTAVPECWQDPLVEKQFIPKLFQILQSGGKGFASSVFPKILPILSTMPREKMGVPKEFFTRLLTNLRTGMFNASLNRSQSESRVVATTYVEVIQYFTMVHREDPVLGHLFVNEFLINTVSAVWKSTLVVFHAVLPFYAQMSQMLRVWHKNSPEYDHLTEAFWAGLENAFNESFVTSITQEDCKKILLKQTTLLAALKNPEKFSFRSKERVRFHTDQPVETNAIVVEASVPGFELALDALAKKVAIKYVEKFSLSNSSIYIEGLLDLGGAFDSSMIYDAVTTRKNLLDMFDPSLKCEVPQEVIVKFGLQLLPHLPEETQKSIVEKMSERDDVDLVLLCRGLLGCTAAGITSWIRGETFSKIYLKLTENIILGRIEASAAEVLCGFLSPVPIVSKNTCHQLLETIISNINEESLIFDEVISLIEACGRDIIYTSEFDRLICTLFCVSCCSHDDEHSRLLRSSLMRRKASCLADPDTVVNLAKGIREELWKVDFVPESVKDSVCDFIEIVCDVNLREPCDEEEVAECIPVIQTFLYQTPAVSACAVSLKTRAFDASELCNYCSVQYYQLKTESVLSNVPATCSNEAIAAYLKWLQLSSLLVDLILTANVFSEKSEDMLTPARVVVNFEYKIRPSESDLDEDVDDIIDKEIKAEGLEKTFSSEEERTNTVEQMFPEILSILEGIAVFDLVVQFCPEVRLAPNKEVVLDAAIGSVNTFLQIKIHQIISQKFQQLRSSIQMTMDAITPSEFNYIYNSCRTLVKTDVFWCTLGRSMIPILRRRFKGCWRRDTYTELVSEILAPPGLTSSSDKVLALTAIVKECAHCITLDQWSNVFIQLEGILKSLEPANSLPDLKNLGSVSSFFVVTQDVFLNCLHRKDEERLPHELIKMWNDVVEKELWTQLFSLWQELCNKWILLEENSDEVYFTSNSVSMRRLCSAIAAGIYLRQPEELNNTLDFLEDLSALLLSPYGFLQVTAFKILMGLIPELVQADSFTLQSSVAETPDTEEKALFTVARNCNWTVKRLSATLNKLQTVVEALLIEFKTGDTCTVEPYSDAFTYTHGYLLLCCLILEMCQEAHVALRFQYGAWLKNDGHLSFMLKSVFNFMPAYVIHGEGRDTAHLFETIGNLSIDKPPSSSWVEHRACYLYRLCLQWLPAAVRAWWSEAEPHVGAIIAQATSFHVSPLLIASELRRVQEDSVAELENISISVSPVAREVVGSYIIDEAIMKITITLPSNYPLGTIKVDLSSHNMIPRAWKISMFLVHRNGSLKDALTLWKSDLDKKFEGVEECKICFSILYGPNFDIPKQICSTCHKKFHSACLYKWFSTSNKSSCPHCRNQF